MTDVEAVLPLLFLVVLIGLPIAGRLVTKRLTSPTHVPLVGTLPQIESWFPEAMRKSVSGFSKVKWTTQAYTVSDEQDNPTHYGGKLLGNGGSYRVEVKLPLYQVGQAFTKDRPLEATVTLSAYNYRAHPAYLIFLGKYPDGPAILARKRVINQLRRGAKKAARSS